jgi:hypothetical protein
MDGQFVTSDLGIKLLQFKSVLLGHEASALVAFSIPIDGAERDARVQLASALAALNDLPNRLDASAGIRGELISAD